MLTIRSPAKVNLSFRILARRANGYHEIVSHMQAVDLFDTLTITSAAADKLTCSDPTLSCGKDNLVWRAVALFREKTGWDTPLDIHVDKRIPTQAGLGGGSSNAASTLYALWRICPLSIDWALLPQWGAELGADVPFFFSSGNALCRGIGERVENIPFTRRSYVIIKPPFGISTQAVYAHCSPKQGELIDFHSDLETAACALYPELLEIKRAAYAAGFHSVVLTGSGSAFVCLGSESSARGGALSKMQRFRVESIQRKKQAWYA